MAYVSHVIKQYPVCTGIIVSRSGYAIPYAVTVKGNTHRHTGTRAYINVSVSQRSQRYAYDYVLRRVI
jgi:hypothetical protein